MHDSTSTMPQLDALLGTLQAKPRKVAWLNTSGHVTRRTHLVKLGARKTICGRPPYRVVEDSKTGRLCVKCVAYLVGLPHSEVLKIGAEIVYDNYWREGGEKMETTTSDNTHWWDRMKE